MKSTTQYASVLGRFAISLGVLALLGSGCLPVDHEHPQYKVNVQAVEAATKASQSASGAAEAAAKSAAAAAAKADAAAKSAADAVAKADAAAERAQRAADKAEAVFEKSMKK